MFKRLIKSLAVAYNKTVTSIAFLPAIIALFFLLLSYFAIWFDFSDVGKSVKANLHWLSLKDASTARSICSAIAGGVISLTVFSFSMVMILLNQAASQMTNRILDKVIGNRFQQIVLGFYIGTIVYALFLLSTIRDINSGIYVPAISVYLLIALTIVDIFLFIYFLHYVTQTVKYETIIHRVYDDTRHAMIKSCFLKEEPNDEKAAIEGDDFPAFESGLFQGFDRDVLLDVCKKEDVVVSFIYPVGTYLIADTSFAKINYKKKPSDDFYKTLKLVVNIDRGKEIKTSFYYGFRQLMEIAIKALSPGINDPGTAVISLQSIGDLLALRLKNFPQSYIKDSDGRVRIIANQKSFEEIFTGTIYPIWHYGKNDRIIQHEMRQILLQLEMRDWQPVVESMLKQVEMQIAKTNENL